MTALIISGGDYSPIDNLSFDCVIACDRGYLHARKMGIRPDLIIGDFDSAPFPDVSVPVESYPARKDDTDTMLAVKHGLLKGFDRFVILGALGGRLDHTIANLSVLEYLKAHTPTSRPPRSPRNQALLSVCAATIRKRGSSVTGQCVSPGATVIPFPYSASQIPVMSQLQAPNMNAVIL